ncbi:hypothetical protein [Streptomyces sp. x-80]
MDGETGSDCSPARLAAGPEPDRMSSEADAEPEPEPEPDAYAHADLR